MEHYPNIGDAIVNESLKWVGQEVHYMRGGKSRSGVDCSGFVWRVHDLCGCTYAYANTAAFTARTEFEHVELPRTGDVVLFPGHMGIFFDRGSRNIISAQSGAGKVVHGKTSWFGAIKGYYRWKSGG